MKRNIFSVFFVFCLTFPLFGIAQKHLHNGFVAATSTGVYYLQDGFDEWVSLGSLLKPEVLNYKRNYDTITSISFYKYELGAVGYSQHNNITASFTTMDYYNVFGKSLTERPGVPFSSSTTINMISKIATNKLKDNYIVQFDMHEPDAGILRIIRNGIDYDYDFITYPAINNFTSLATDNDSILVWTGTNNVLYKTVISPTVGYRSNTAVSGLTSNASSGHQICYDSGNDLFWIMGMDGLPNTEAGVEIYTYDKTTVEYIGGGMGADTIFDSDFDETNNNLCYCVRNGDSYFLSGIGDNYTIGEDVTRTKTMVISTDNKGNCYYFFGNQFFRVDESGSDTPIELDALPSGTIVYDLDYIDYIPYIEPYWTYEGVLTVGTDEINWIGYSMDYLFGSINPEDTDISNFWWNSSTNTLRLSLTVSAVITDVYVNSVEYNDLNYVEGVMNMTGVSNPFPAVGEQCDIKLKYTMP